MNNSLLQEITSPVAQSYLSITFFFKDDQLCFFVEKELEPNVEGMMLAYMCRGLTEYLNNEKNAQGLVAYGEKLTAADQGENIVES